MGYNLQTNLVNHFGWNCIDATSAIHDHFTVFPSNLSECVENGSAFPVILLFLLRVRAPDNRKSSGCSNTAKSAFIIRGFIKITVFISRLISVLIRVRLRLRLLNKCSTNEGDLMGIGTASSDVSIALTLITLGGRACFRRVSSLRALAIVVILNTFPFITRSWSTELIGLYGS
jgi:hypothetical protein